MSLYTFDFILEEIVKQEGWKSESDINFKDLDLDNYKDRDAEFQNKLKELINNPKRLQEEIEKRFPNKNKEIIDEVLETPKKPKARLGQGLYNNVFYYGTTLKFEGKPISAIITSEPEIYLGIDKYIFECPSCGTQLSKQVPSYIVAKEPKICSCGRRGGFKLLEIFNQIKDRFGLNYRTEFNEDALDTVWATEEIKDFIKKGKKKIFRNHKLKLKEIYEEILRINKKYIDHLNPSSHKYTTCWIIATYCYSLFEQFGRLYNRAQRGSGKTKQARILKWLCFNPMWITKGTESSQFRDAEATCGTFIVDNLDKLHDDLKKAIEHFIETAWMIDATYRLTNKDTMRTEKYQAYSPMAINNIFGLDENTIDKTFEISMLQSVNNSIKRLKVTHSSENWEKIRKDLRFWMLENWEEIQKTYNNLHGDFSGRAFDVAEGALTIAKLIDEDLFKELEAYCIEKLEEEIIDLENNHSYIVFSKIWSEFMDNPTMQETNVYLTDLSDILFKKFNPDLLVGSPEYNNRKKGFSKYLARIIRAVPMFRKGGLSQGRTYIKIKRSDLEQYMKLQKFINDDGTLLTSTTSTTSTKLPKPTKNPSKVGLVEQVGLVEENSRVEETVKSEQKTDFTHKSGENGEDRTRADPKIQKCENCQKQATKSLNNIQLCDDCYNQTPEEFKQLEEKNEIN